MDDLINEFITETNESLGQIDQQLVNLEQNPNDKPLLSSIFRLMHTIKGTCGFLGLPRLEKCAHHAENVLGLFREGKLVVTSDYVTLIFESIDRIKSLMGVLETTGKEPEGNDADLIEKLDAVYEGREPGKTAPAAAAPETPAAAPDTTLIGGIPAHLLEPDEHGFVPTPAFGLMQTIEPAPTPTPEPVVAVTPAPAAPSGAPAAPAGDHGGESALAASSLRVNVEVLENLMNMVSELVLTRNQLLQILRNAKENEFTVPLQRLNHVVSDLQEGVMKTRMQPIGNAWSKLPRIVRDLTRELGKKVDLEMRGQDTELDRQVLDLIKDPLTHMVRNSADHGVEMPAERIAKGKPETGKVILEAFHEGGHIIIRISDDGKGLNMTRIKQKAIENGVATAEEIAGMSNKQIQQFIFAAGFSTAEKVTSVSGRGVGMDVVRTNIEKIGGTIDLNSEEGKGSTFTIKIPLTLAIVSALIVECAGERYAMPQLSVQELVMASDNGETKIETINGSPVFRLRDHLLPLVSLQELLQLPDYTPPVTANNNRRGRSNNRYIIVAKVGSYSFGIIVDRVFDTEEIVVKPVARILSNIEMFSGNTILGDGSVIMILDPNGIAKATGEVAMAETSAERDAAQAAKQRNVVNKTALLLFAAGADKTPKAVPLGLVARLEDIEIAKMEETGGQKLIQYRGALMPLVPFDTGMKMHPTGMQPTLVFSDGNRSMGLMVDEIIDIIDDALNVQISSEKQGLLGTAIIREKATDIIDVGHYIGVAHEEWFKDHGDENFGDDAMSSSRRLLLVDDSPFFRNMLTPLLAVAGYDVVTAENPLKALELQERGERFDIIVSDIEMPEMNGYEFAEKVKTDGTWKDTPMVALTSHATPKDLERGRAVGFNKYLMKFDREILLNTLVETLAEKQGFGS